MTLVYEDEKDALVQKVNLCRLFLVLGFFV
jgi:hypothetical protein